MTKLISLTQALQDQPQAVAVFNPVGSTVYAANGKPIGTVKDALVEEGNVTVRHLLIDLHGEESRQPSQVPVHLARIEHDGLYFDTLSLEQLRTMTVQASHLAAHGAANHTAHQELQAAEMQDGRSLLGTIELRQELPAVQVRREKLGEVTVRRERRVREETVTLELVTEVLIIETRAGAGQVVFNGQPLAAGETTEVEIYREHAEVVKQVVKTEDVQVYKTTHTEQVAVPVQLAYEELVVQDTREQRASLDSH